ncbi:MAG: aminotransferase class I/II-fold pyridoxal phosphate-dependent enzyme [Symbiobacteriaceae bacterium]|nr:aminotransferase class I/II-fold pyridoxal phosphate-dependent enzyme [Symbiobacteriaceae bacterium]
MPRIYLSPPHISPEGYEQEYVAQAFASNWIAPLGAFVDRFEEELAVLTHRRGGAALSSGTAAIHLALRSCGLEPGDKVLSSSFTFAATCNPIIYEQGLPVFIDSEYTSWNIDPDLVEQALAEGKKSGKQAKALLAVSLYGQAANLPRLSELCDYYGVALIDEATEALGASIAGRPCGSFGKFGVLSFNGNKIITTSGGGALVADDLEALAKIRFWATQSRDPAPHYQHSELGFNYRLSNICAAIGCGQLQVLSRHLAARQAVFHRYSEGFQAVPAIEMMPRYGEPNHWLSVITFTPESRVTPQKVAAALAAEDIESRPAWKPMNLQPYWGKYPFYSRSASGSVGADLFARGLCLPSGSALSQEDQDKIIAIVTACCTGSEPS